MENRCNTKIFFFLLGMLLLFPFVSAFSGSGTGTLADPYQISNCTQLQEMNNSLSANYSLMNNIDCSDTVNWNGGEGFEPIGIISGNAFNGFLDGNYNNVSYLTINRSTNNNSALFYNLSSSARIYDLNLINPVIKGDYVSSISLYNYGEISNVLVSNATISGYHVRVLVNDGNRGGGMVTNNYGTIIDSSISGNFYIQSSSTTQTGSHAGGLVGYNYGIIKSCYSNINITVVIASNPSSGSDGGSAGGLVGKNYGTINKSYSIGNVILNCGNDGFDFCYGGGFVAETTGNITNSYSRGNFTWSGAYPQRLYIGGFAGAVGPVSSGAFINNSYATGKVTPTNVITSVCGIAEGGFSAALQDRVGSVFWDINTTGVTAATGHSYTPLEVSCGGAGGGTGLTTIQMKQQSSYVGWDFNNIWGINPLINEGYPYLLLEPIEPIEPTFFLLYPPDNYKSNSNTTAYISYKVQPNCNIMNNISVYIDGINNSYSWDNIIDKYTHYGDALSGENTIRGRALTRVNDSYFLIVNFTGGIVYAVNRGSSPSLWNFSIPYDGDAITTNQSIIFIGKDNSVYRYDMTGSYLGSSFLTTATDAQNISGLANDNTYIWITDSITNKVYRFWMNGTYSGFNFSTIGIKIRGIAVDNNLLYLTDEPLPFPGEPNLRGRAYVYYSNGTYSNTFNLTTRDPWGIVVGNSTTLGLISCQSKAKVLYSANNDSLNIGEHTLEDTIQNSNWTASLTKILSEGEHEWYIKVFYNNTYSATSNIRTLTFDTISPEITITSPTEYQTFNYLNNIPFVITETDNLAIDKCWYSKNNGATNTTYTCASDFTVTEAGDGSYNVIVWANDTLGNLNRASRNYVVDTTSGGGGTPAFVSINYPTYGSGINSIPTSFNVTATDSDGIKNVSLWTNSTGVWHLEETNTTPVTSGVMYNISKSLSEGTYKFNFQVFDNTNLESWASSNYTFVLDNTIPLAAITTITTTAGDRAFSFSSAESDSNLKSCKYSIFNSTGGVDGISNNVTYTCNSNPHPAATWGNYGTYTLTTFVTDIADNVKSTSLNFTTSAFIGGTVTPIIGGGGGGGGLDLNETLSAIGFCGDNICQDGTNGTIDRGEDFYSCSIDCSRIYSIFSFDTFNFETLVSNCFSSVAETQDRCFWKKTPGLLVLIVLIISFFVFSIFFSIKPLSKGGTKKIIYNRRRRR
jgi:hypothetical protein